MTVKLINLGLELLVNKCLKTSFFCFEKPLIHILQFQITTALHQTLQFLVIINASKASEVDHSRDLKNKQNLRTSQDIALIKRKLTKRIIWKVDHLTWTKCQLYALVSPDNWVSQWQIEQSWPSDSEALTRKASNYTCHRMGGGAERGRITFETEMLACFTLHVDEPARNQKRP